ncbi:ABC transporter permease [Sphingobacterium tabacisoli]|uniref:ABC transporter permease n=1 Tax=Sphingobacterium tabacisoli TaxID=2044855 RepID=A0ABW5KY13_9SPHI|nr:ABC transporter permease [Sphingobacterium tabacisoli]
MIRHFFITAIRHLSKHKKHTLLNVWGLALAIACCLFIYTFVVYQLGFDRFHRQSDRIFMIVQDLKLEQLEHSKGGSYAMYTAIEKEIPQVEHVTLYMDKQDLTLKINNKLFKTEGKAAFTNATYFDILNFPWLAGDVQQLNEPNTVALTKAIAERYFGTTDAIGKTIWVESQHPVTVVGIIDDSRRNSDFRSEIYFALASVKELKGIKEDGTFNNWGYTHTSNNILMSLRQSNAKSLVEKSLHDLVAKHWHKDVLEYYSYRLLGLPDFHFDKDYGSGTQKSLLLILGSIGLGILGMASVNYINMTSAQQLYRSTEMGIRKALGGTKKQLFLQFTIETLLLSLIALILAWLLFFIAFDWANKYLFLADPIQRIPLGSSLIISLLLWWGIAILTSIYPSLFLKQLHIQTGIKKLALGRWNITQRTLVVLQNSIALLLVTGTIVIVSQVRYLKNTDKGFDRSSALIIPIKSEMWSQKEKISNLLRENPAIISYSFCDNPPSYDKVWGGTVQFDDNAEWETWAPRFAIGDSSYLRTFGIHLLAGNNFNHDMKNPQFLINETMLNKLGYTHAQDIIGKNLMAGGLNDQHKGKIIGVVADFSTHSLNEAIAPTVLGYNETRFKNIAIKYAGTASSRLLNTLEQQWKSLYPNEVFEYHFYDEQIANLYKKEALLEKLIWIAAMLSITISTFGFLGLLSVIIAKRTKEIGIRKVLGSSNVGIFQLLAKDFVRWVLIAFLISAPVAWYLLSKWLEDFTYHITLSWWMFVLTGIIGIFTTLLTISFQSFKAAKTNPVNSLRDE